MAPGAGRAVEEPAQPANTTAATAGMTGNDKAVTYEFESVAAEAYADSPS